MPESELRAHYIGYWAKSRAGYGAATEEVRVRKPVTCTLSFTYSDATIPTLRVGLDRAPVRYQPLTLD